MSVHNAEVFLCALRDRVLRHSLYALDSLDEFEAWLEKKKMSCRGDEVIMAHKNLHARCQSEEEADYLQECFSCYKMLVLGWQTPSQTSNPTQM